MVRCERYSAIMLNFVSYKSMKGIMYNVGVIWKQ